MNIDKKIANVKIFCKKHKKKLTDIDLPPYAIEGAKKP
jgi:hypothetical protein